MSKVETIDLLRHGEVSGDLCFRGRSDHPLTDLGREQMQQSVEGHGPWDRIITSPLSRCATAARDIGKRLSLEVIVDDDLQEIDFGEWEGATMDEISQRQPQLLEQFWSNPFKNGPPGGEPYPIFYDRVVGCWEKIIAEQRQCKVLLVTHGGVIRALLSHTLAIPESHLLRLEMPHASLSRIAIHHLEEGGYLPSLRFMNR